MTVSAWERLFSAMHPTVVEKTDNLASGQSNLVHYTSAENAMNIIKNEQFWLRNVRCMNDYSEVQHGINMLIEVFHANEGAVRKRIVEIFDRIAPGAAVSAIENFDRWIEVLPHSTFIGCLSEWDEEEDHGRLSMWRAYTNNGSGVALVLDHTPFAHQGDELKAYTIPVSYVTSEDFSVFIDNILNFLDGEIMSFKDLDSENVQYLIFWWLLTLAVGLKHPAFKEEREWRIVYIPAFERSPAILEESEVVRGIPQIVQKIPLCHDPEIGLDGANIENMIRKIIVGPTDYPLIIRDSFLNELKKKGIENAEDRLSLSFIPLRSN